MNLATKSRTKTAILSLLGLCLLASDALAATNRPLSSLPAVTAALGNDEILLNRPDGTNWTAIRGPITNTIHKNPMFYGTVTAAENIHLATSNGITAGGQGHYIIAQGANELTALYSGGTARQIIYQDKIRFDLPLYGDGTGLTNLPYDALSDAAKESITNAAAGGSADGAGLTNFNLLSVAGLGPELKRTESLPLYTHQRLYHTNVARVLFVGDSLTAGSYDRMAAHAFMNTMLAHYGTNGFFGGGNDGKPWVPLSSAGIGWDETTDLWISGLLTVTNGSKQVWKLNAGDGYQTADSAGIVWVKDPAGGTLTVSTISAELVTNTVATIDTAGASGTGGTNITFEAARVMLQVSAASGDCKIAVPGLWHAAGAGVRYGWLGRGGLNNYVTLADANGWWDGLATYTPDLVVINEIGSSELLEFIRDLQALWPRTDFVIVAPHPVSTDVTSTTELAVRMDWANFARTNRAVTYFDGFELLGGARGYQTLTNIGAIYWNGTAFDGTHMSATNKMVQDILAARLLRELQLAQPSFTRSAYARAVKPIDDGVTLSGNFSGRFTPQTNMVWRTVRDIWTDNGSGSYSYTVPTVWTPVYPSTGPYFRGHLIGAASKYHHVEFGPQDTLGRTNAVFTSYYVTTNATTFPARCAVGVRDIENVATLTVMLGTAATYTTAPDGTNTHKFVRAVSWSPDVTNAIVNVEVGTGSGTVSNTFLLYGVKAEFY